jgi:DMSO/TMAO reductase YedYZ molybdopterin-dependent catalytic subunit
MKRAGRAADPSRGHAAPHSDGALPPNQMPTRLFPVIGEREPEPFDPLTWRLEIDGLVEHPLSLSWSDLAGLPHVSRTGTIHCVTRWSRPETTFHGVRLAHLLKRAGPRADARFVRFVSGRGHDSTLPLGRAKKEVLVADGFEGERDEPGALAPEHGGPVRSVVMDRYFYKSVKWLRRIELLDADRLGFWERTAGYHNDADPWREQRYIAHDLDRVALRRLLDARDLSTQNLLGAELEGANLDGFRLESTNLRNAKLKNASLRGADLREALLCNADLRFADLRQTLIDGIDLDGADLRGADLRGARGRPASMAAAQFSGSNVAVGGDGDGAPSPEDSGPPDCRVDGLDWAGTALDAALPDQLAFLRAHGVLRA